MPHRCVVGGCGNTKKGVNLHRWPKSPYHRLWTNAVKNTRSDFTSPSPSRMICIVHFTENCFEPQTIISRDLGMSFRPVLKKDVVPMISSSGKRTHDKLAGASPQPTACSSSQELKRPRSAFRKRDCKSKYFLLIVQII